MSGTLPQYRPGSRPTDEIIGVKRVLHPGGRHENGRCVEWFVRFEPVFRHVLDYTPQYHRPSKHARGRIRPRTRAEQRRAENRIRRFTQISKTMTVDQNTFRAIHDEA